MPQQTLEGYYFHSFINYMQILYHIQLKLLNSAHELTTDFQKQIV